MAGWNPRDRRWIGFLPVAVFLVSSAALFGWWQDLVRAQERWLEQRLHAEATSLAIKVSERFDAYDAILRGGAAIFAASTVVTRDEFHTYVDALRLARNYPGIQGLGFSAWVPPERLEAFERAVRAEGFPDFAVRPPGPRDDYSAVLYLEPFTERNRLAFGLDGLAEPLRRAAMERARARNEASTTAMLRLAQENGDDVQPGVITFFPVRRPLSPPGVGGLATPRSRAGSTCRCGCAT